MQAYSPALPVGAQHNYRSSFHALSEVVKNEGKLGLVRGVGSAMLRTAMVSSRQCKSWEGKGSDEVGYRDRRCNCRRIIMQRGC
jgi:hypothetical protein